MKFMLSVIRANTWWENLFAIVVMASAAVASAGVALSLLQLTGLLSPGVAGWVQAIGSIAAIYFSAQIGRKQAETALTIHFRDVEFQNKQYERELEDRRRDEERVATARYHDALAEASVHRSGIKRLTLNLVGMVNSIEQALRAHKEARAKLVEAQEELNEARQGDTSLVGLRATSVTQRQDALDRSEADIAQRACDLEAGVSLLAQLPRSSIRQCSTALADRVASAINHLQRAIIELEHSREPRRTVSYLVACIRELEGYSADLERLLACATDHGDRDD
ncbi:hypothetical protein [Bordetella sp. 02P26C-1]|uniref:hypothetical protein n=1 Tax=Bordetella sp. 02P26C-1 TaxID=2683195 RepID=UPI001356232E|nr:hypothetical protein [Bordetella sp. 02P26C-1]MVW80209.1 hypothetical protein [Bordetella sp. 02P26C-1]